MKLGCNAVPVVAVFVLMTVLVHFSSGCNITNVAYVNNTPDSLSLTWDLTPDCSSLDFPYFRITALHRKFLACNEETNNSITTFETKEKSITLRNLHPFSEYKIGIVAQGSRNPATTAESTLEVTTPPGIPKFRPRRSDQSNLALVQAIKFYWAVPDHDTCRERNGRPSGYIIELWGDDPWVSSNNPLVKREMPEHFDFFYAQKLLPFTRYRLKVFVVNADKSYNPEMPLELRERTSATVPSPPEEVRAEPKSPTSINLRFNPKYPPNGLISMYAVGIGTKDNKGEIDWKKRLEFLPNNSRCYQSPTGFTLQVCFLIDDLMPDTNYSFHVQVYNENVTQPSEYSQTTAAKTFALPQVVTSTTTTETKDPNDDETTTAATTTTTTNTTTSVADEHFSPPPENDSLSSTHILIIALSLVAFILLALIGSTLVYKIKMTKLKMRYRLSNVNGGPESFISTPGYPHSRSMSTFELSGGPSLFGTSQRSKSISGQIFGSPCMPGVMSGSTSMSNGFYGMSTANFIQSVANQIEEIQNRRLPEPPSSQMPSLVPTINEEDDEDSKSGAYVQIESSDSGHGTLVSRFHSGRHATSNQTESTGCRPTSEQEATDMYGYLKPTFHQYSTSSDHILPTTAAAASNYSEPIPVESYASAPSGSGGCGAAGSSNDIPVTDSSSENSTSTTEPCYDMPRSMTPATTSSSEASSSSLNRNEIRPLIPSHEAVLV